MADAAAHPSSPSTVRSEDSVQELTRLAGTFQKQSHGLWTRWSKRRFLLQGGVLFWSNRELTGDTVELRDSAKVSFIDLSQTSVEVHGYEVAGLVIVKPSSRSSWHTGDRHGCVRHAAQLFLRCWHGLSSVHGCLQKHSEFARLSLVRRVASERSWRDEGLNLDTVAISELPAGAEAECSVCCEAFDESGDSCGIVRTACGHHFHAACLHRWTMVSSTCPLCRTSLHV